MLCYWFGMGLIEEELVEEGREDLANHHERKRQSIGRRSTVKGKGLSIELLHFFFNVVLTWKIVRVSETLVIYIYI